MASLALTMIDVAWGDSLLLEFTNDAGESSFGLIDSNDGVTIRPSYMYLKRFFERRGLYGTRPRMFEFIILSHAHADHGKGLKTLIQEFGAENFWYPRTSTWSSCTSLLQYAKKARTKIGAHQAIDADHIIPDIKGAKLDVLWPERDFRDVNENEHSIIMTVRLGDVAFILTGDAEEKAWSQVSPMLPQEVKVFKIPHHGSIHGFFDSMGNPLWLDQCQLDTVFGISSHVRSFSHPDQSVLDRLGARKVFRTDEHYHMTFQTEGASVRVKYSHY